METGIMVFDHVHLLSENVIEAADWYVEKLDGKIIARAEAAGSLQMMVEFDGVKIIIRGRRPGEAPDHKEGQQWGTDHFGFSVDGDFDGFCRELKQKGVVFTLEPVNFAPTVRIAFIEAPDGVSIELLKRKIN
jgi:lactoylglutathione lyase